MRFWTFRGDSVLLGLLFASLSLNVYLGVKAVPQRTFTPGALSVGTEVPDLIVQTAEGRRQRFLSKDERPLLLYAFTTTCQWCARNTPNIDAVASQIEGRFRFVPLCLDCEIGTAVSIGGVRPFIRPSDQTTSAYKLGPVPFTVMIGADGRVQNIWRGALIPEEIRADVEKVLSVKLPDNISRPTSD